MKTILKEIQMTIQDFAELMFEKATTVRSWINRGMTVPFRHLPLFTSLLYYKKAHYPIDWTSLENHFMATQQVLQKKYCENALQRLELDLSKAQHQLKLLNNKRKATLQRWHWSTHLPDYFTPEVAQYDHFNYLNKLLEQIAFKSEQALTQDTRVVGRTYPGVFHQQLMLEQKVVGLEAEIDFLKDKLAGLDHIDKVE